MPTNCPQCNADTSQSSGVVCPACGHILQPGADDLAHAAQVRTKHRFLRLALAFVVPFVAVAACVGIFTLDPAFAVMCGGVVGGLFLVSFLIASARVSHPLGQAFATLLFFLGFAAVLLGVLRFGCHVIFG